MLISAQARAANMLPMRWVVHWRFLKSRVLVGWSLSMVALMEGVSLVDWHLNKPLKIFSLDEINVVLNYEAR